MCSKNLPLKQLNYKINWTALLRPLHNILDISTNRTHNSYPPLILTSTLPQPLTNQTTRPPNSNNLHTNRRTTTSTNRTGGHKEMNAAVNEEEEE